MKQKSLQRRILKLERQYFRLKDSPKADRILNRIKTIEGIDKAESMKKRRR